MPVVTLPDGNKLEFEESVSVKQVAEKIGKKLAKAALAGKVDGVLRDIAYIIENDAAIEIVTPSSEDALPLMRHSASHVLAEAILKLHPGTKLVYGPAIADGFYYDVDSPEPISAEDLPKIEKEMQKIVKRNQPFSRSEMSASEAKREMRRK